MLAEFVADRPLYAAVTRQQLSDATPFTIPADITEAAVGSGVAQHVEGVNPTDGTLAFAGKTINPAAISGTFRCTREIMDASNPAIDAIALGVMREDFARQAEDRIFNELNTVQSGTIAAGLVPSGAQARVSAAAALPADLRKTILAFVDVRKIRVRSVVASSRTTVAEALETLDMTAYAMRDVSLELSPFISGVAAGDGDVFALGSGDVYAWQSPVFEFTFNERVGPAFVDLAVFGYFATKVVKPAGVASIRHT